MKKVISLVLVFVLAVGLGFCVNYYRTEINAADIQPSPENGVTVPLLGGDIYDYATHFSKGVINKYYTKGANKYAPKALTIEWGKVDKATSYAVRLGRKPDLTDSRKYVTMENKLDVQDLYANTTYYYQVTTEVDDTIYTSDITKITTADLPRTVYVDSVSNTRDFGGRQTVDKKYRVKQGIIYRGANVDEISDAGEDKLVNTYGIKTDLDLRGKSKVSPLGSDIKLVSVSAPMYKKGITYDYWYPALKKEILTFADAKNYPIYVHCAIGRDRTGTLCFLIGAIAGMSEKDLLRDYELTFFSNVNGDVDDPAKYSNNNMYAMLNYLKYYDDGNLQQNTMEYMRECLGIKQADLNRIRSNILTPAPKAIPEPTVPTPAKVKLKSVKNVKKKSILVKFKKAKHAVGYEIWWGKKKNTRLIGTKITYNLKYKIKKLKKKKTYYVKVRAFNLNGHVEVYGKYSKSIKVKIKK